MRTKQDKSNIRSQFASTPEEWKQEKFEDRMFRLSETEVPSDRRWNREPMSKQLRRSR